MPTVSVEIPTADYAEFLRIAADFLDERIGRTEDRGTIGLDDEGEPRAWRFSTLEPTTDEDFALLVEYLGKIKGYAASVFDYLVDHGGPVDGNTLAEWLLLDSRRAVAGSLGHAARFANELGRRFPIHWNRDTGTYELTDDLREAIAQARIWTVPAPYIHVLERWGRQFAVQTETRPARYAIFSEELDDSEDLLAGFEGLFYDRNAVHGFDPNAFDEALGFTVIEFTPDSVRREMLVPVELHDDLGLRTERSHDLVTAPPHEFVITGEVRQ